MLSKSLYSEAQTWKQKFKDNSVTLSLKDDKFHKSWKELFEKLYNDKRFRNRIEKELSEELRDDDNLIMHPQPDYVFNAFKLTSFKKLKVVIIGQDPYFDHEIHENKNVSQAMGLSFSVPVGIKVPSSLRNIYVNLKKYGHIENIPEHGNLESWAEQGCLLLNTALTVKDGSANKNCHQFIWGWFTDEIISYISEKKENVVFVLWGSHALGKKDLIDEKKHEIIISSHPSGLSVGKPMKEYPAFNANDHFGKINQKLKEWGRSEIDWNLE
jgi:uracil-DNA glycosylase